MLPILCLIFYNYFIAYNLRFIGCNIKGDIISPLPLPMLEPMTYQQFTMTGYPTVSGNCTYNIAEINSYVDFQWFYDSDSGQEYYGITHCVLYTSMVVVQNITQYFVMDSK